MSLDSSAKASVAIGLEGTKLTTNLVGEIGGAGSSSTTV